MKDAIPPAVTIAEPGRILAVRVRMTAFVCAAIYVGAGLFEPSFARAQDMSGYPVRPVRMITSAAPGGNPDPLSRMFAQYLFNKLGKSFVVENVPGAGGLLAAKTVQAASPDGYTLAIIDGSGLSISSALSSSSEPNPGMELAALASLVSVPTVLVIRPELQVRTLEEFISLAHARPGQLSYGSAGPGSVHHLTMAIFASRAGIDLLHVPYRGGSAMVNGLLTGEIQAGWAGIPNAAQLIEMDQLRAVCLSILTRSVTLPNLPTCAGRAYRTSRSRLCSGFTALPNYRSRSSRYWKKPFSTP